MFSITTLKAQSDSSLPDAPAATPVAAQAADIAFNNTQDSSSSLAWNFLPGPGDTSSPDADTPGQQGSQGAAPDAQGPRRRWVYSGQAPAGPYNWRAMLRQSLFFTGAEDFYRLNTDPFMRHLIADGPYWRNYMDSLGQWNMRRWNDGDDFLVDFIGHPMQGAVSGFIEIQNSPRQRYLRVSGSRDYWNSRLHALMWSTAFSTQQKIGPLGEAALGSAGGYTYTLHCPFPCTTYVPGKTKYTNNTGWTDFITTPVIGTLWTVLEDFLDREVSDPIAAHMPRIPGNIVRGSLNPTRTMANFMRGKKPWYRDWQNMPEMSAALPPLPSSGSDSGRYIPPRFELFPHLDAISLPVNTASCTRCRQTLYGPGIGFSAGLTRYVDFDSDVNIHSNASPVASDRAGGSIVMGTFGLRSGWRTERFAIRAAIRPGFLSYDKALEASPTTTDPTPPVGRITHFTTALAISADGEISRHLGVRFVVDNTPVRYREPNLRKPAGVGAAPYFNWLSHEIFLTNENWGYQTGMVLRF